MHPAGGAYAATAQRSSSSSERCSSTHGASRDCARACAATSTTRTFDTRPGGDFCPILIRISSMSRASTGTSSPLGQVLAYAALVFALTAPLWLMSSKMRPLAPGLPAAAVAVVCPALAAWVFAQATYGSVGVAAWWKHARLELPARGHWLLFLASTLPIGVMLISMIWQRGETASHTRALAPITLFAFVPAFLIGAWLEEAGWSALAAETLLPARAVVSTALVIGAIWALWHLIPLTQVGHSPTWIAWWIVGTVAMRVTLVWLYARSDHHALAPTLFHASDNLCWQGQISLGAAFDPRMHSVLMIGIAIILVAVNGRAGTACGMSRFK